MTNDEQSLENTFVIYLEKYWRNNLQTSGTRHTLNIKHLRDFFFNRITTGDRKLNKEKRISFRLPGKN